MTGVQKVGARVEELLEALKSGGFGPAADAAEELVGLLVEGLVGPLAPDATGHERDKVQSLTLVALRALGVADARARGLVVQTVVSNQ